MDSLKTLMDRKEYDLVLKITENSQDSLGLFYRLSALLAVGKSEDALKLIKTKREILKSKLSLLMKIHIEILCLLGKFDEAYDELKYYQELPYENQETEEMLAYLPKYIREEEIKLYKKKEVGQDEIRKKLVSKSDNDVLTALDAIRELPLDSFILPIQNILRSYPKQSIRAFALLLLVARKYDKKVSYLYFDELREVIPASLNEPFVLKDIGTIDDLSQLLQNTFHDPSLVQTIINLVSSYIVYTYPEPLPYSKEEIIAIFGYLGKEMLQSKDNSVKALCQEYNLDEVKVREQIALVKGRLDEF